MYTVPCSNDLLGSIKVPLGLIIQPMAAVKSNEVHSIHHISCLHVYICDRICEKGSYRFCNFDEA